LLLNYHFDYTDTAKLVDTVIEEKWESYHEILDYIEEKRRSHPILIYAADEERDRRGSQQELTDRGEIVTRKNALTFFEAKYP